jgi:hypothetical protein
MKTTSISIFLVAAFVNCSLTSLAADSDPHKPWIVQGTVVDESGTPLSDVDIYANTGIGSLKIGGHTKSKADGTFEFRFGPGYYSEDQEGVQAATISPHKEGWFETNLHRQGDLVAAYKLPKGEIGWGKKTAADVFLPNEPKTLKFTMARAASVSGVLLDASGKPLANKRVGVTGDEIPPSSSVFAEVKTDDDGAFEFKNLPTTYALKIYSETARNWRDWPSVTVKLGKPEHFKTRLEQRGDRFVFSSEPSVEVLDANSTREAKPTPKN